MEPTKPFPGFLFKVSHQDNPDEIKGYLLGVEHSADKEILQQLENEKITSLFEKTMNFYFESTVRMVNDIEQFYHEPLHSKDELSQNQLEEYSKRIVYLSESLSAFAEFIGINESDIELKKTLPGLDYQLLMKAFEERGMNSLHSLEPKNASKLSNADEKTIPQYLKNITDFFEDSIPQNFLKPVNPTIIEKNLNIPQILKNREEALKTSNLANFLLEQAKLDGDFFTNKDEENPAIAFQRNRELNLARKVDTLLKSSNDNLFVFGLSHLVSTDRINLLDLLKARGWIISLC